MLLRTDLRICFVFRHPRASNHIRRFTDRRAEGCPASGAEIQPSAWIVMVIFRRNFPLLPRFNRRTCSPLSGVGGALRMGFYASS